MAGTPTVYTDDTDPSWTFTVRSGDGTDVDWATPVVAVGSGDYTIDATWLGDPAATRRLRVPLDGLTAGGHTLYLQVPNGADIKLGNVSKVARK